MLNTTSGGTTKVDADTVYRIGSISKTVTVLELLLHEGKVSFDDPVTMYIPELAAITAISGVANEINEPLWAEITVGSLTSYLSGIGRDCEFHRVLSWGQSRWRLAIWRELT